MGYYSIVVPSDQAWEVFNQLGKLSAVQFTDQNSDQAVFNRRYASYIRRCEEAERRLRFLLQEQERFKVHITESKDSLTTLDLIDRDLLSNKIPAQAHFENIENELETLENSLILQLKNYEQLTTGIEYLNEKKIILSKARDAFGGDGEQAAGSFFSKMAGIIENEDIVRFKRMVFRITRGNALSVFYEIENPEADKNKKGADKKSVFFIMYQGDQSGNISSRLGRICDTIGIRRYAVPGDPQSLDQEWRRNEEEIAGNTDIMDKTKQAVVGILRKLATPRAESACSVIEEHRLFILKEKSIYHHLNMFNLRGNMFYGNCWCPKSDESRILKALSAGYLKEVEGGFPANQTPPTFFRLNDFTAPFQSIVDTYGIPNYQEANPAFFSAVTFPFLFGVMFGDVGHGLVLTIFASYLCWCKDSIHNSNGLFKPAVPVRYLLLMMGLCATYCGFIYNDFLGIPFNFFGSGWSEGKSLDHNQRTLNKTYPFGLDPIWYRSKNELIFFNSFKMKLSVIFGVIQMICGNFFKGANAIHFRSKTDFFFEFIPQLVFMSSIFGYMILMIFIKWCTPWNYNFNDDAPNLITVLMNMFLKLGKLDDDGRALWGDGSQQESIQTGLLLVGLLAVPFMLFPKPIILYYAAKKLDQGHGVGEYQEFDKESHGHNKEHEFGEIFIHQMIETIEYVLGAVSNTASYLRLWALSLAHAQLANVFFEKTMVSTIESGNPVLVVVGFFMFANVSVGVLMCMDSLECFLHALRLHWVEFMNKFYKGVGIRFFPFSFDEVIKIADAKRHG